MSQYVYSLTRFQSSVVFFVLCMRLCGRANWSACALPVHDSSVVAVVRALVFLSFASFVGPRNSSGRFVSQCFRFCFFAVVCSYICWLACCFVRFFVSSLVCSFVISVMLVLVCFFVHGCSFGAFALCDVR